MVDPDNPHIAIGHLKCAAHELPLRDDEVPSCSAPTPTSMLELLEEDRLRQAHRRPAGTGRSTEYPAAEVNLRNIAGPVYTIQDAVRRRAGDRHDGRGQRARRSCTRTRSTCTARTPTSSNKLDLEQKIAFVEQRDLDYYTQSVQVSQIRIDETEEETRLARRRCSASATSPSPPPSRCSRRSSSTRATAWASSSWNCRRSRWRRWPVARRRRRQLVEADDASSSWWSARG